MSSKPQYYVEYLGWKQAHGLHGKDFTESIVRGLLLRRRRDALPRLTLKLNKKELQISPEMAAGGGRGRRSSSEKVKYPPIPSRDITFVSQSSPPDGDVVACIFLGYNPNTKCAVHAHVYRFDRAETATQFIEHVRKIIDMREYRERIIGIEKDLAEQGHIVMRRESKGLMRREPAPDYSQANGGPRSAGFYVEDNTSDGQSWGSHSDNSGMSPAAQRYAQQQQSQQQQQQQLRYPPPAEALRSCPDIHIEKKERPVANSQEQHQLFSNLQEELDYKLHLQGPILLPPKDYDTILRKHGKIETRDQRKSKNARIVGPNRIFGTLAGGTDGQQAPPAHSPQSSFSANGAIDETSSMGSTETENTGGAASDASGSARSGGQGTNGWPSPRGQPQKPPLRRSSSEAPTNAAPGAWGRQDSCTSDPSINSEDFTYADGLYSGIQARAPHGRSKGQGSLGNNNNEDKEPTMVMWDQTYSYETSHHRRQSSGPAHMGHHHGHENDLLSRTAPAGAMHRYPIPANGGGMNGVALPPSAYQRKASGHLR